jgi:hypothetical protein
MVVLDSNDGSLSLCVGIGILLNNNEGEFYRFYNNGKTKFRHTATIEQKKSSISTLIDNSLSEITNNINILKRFSLTKLSDEMIDDLVLEIHSLKDIKTLNSRQKNMIILLRDCIDNEIKKYANNALSIFKGIISYTNNNQVVPKRDNAKNESIISGISYKKNMIAFDYLNKLI